MIFSKNELRNTYRKLRKEAKAFEKDKSICSAVVENTFFKKADTVFVYFSSNSEVDTLDIIEKALSEGKNVALPKCIDRQGKMDFYIISDIKASLKEGMFSLMEPDSDKCEKAADSVDSLCIVPGLSFDKKGYRLGYGGGYYDRFLSKFKGTSIGLCYDECFCCELPFDEYDRKVDLIITDKEIYTVT